MSRQAENRKQAPLCSAFVDALREQDPQATPTFVSEGELRWGKRLDGVLATCYFGGNGKPIAEFLKK